MDGQVPKQVVQERYDRLMALRRGDHLGGEQEAGRRARSRCWSPSARAARTRATGRMSGRARDGRLVHFARRRSGRDPARRHRRDATVTYAAPHHLNADGPLVSHRRTRAGDAWAAAGSPVHRA